MIHQSTVRDLFHRSEAYLSEHIAQSARSSPSPACNGNDRTSHDAICCTFCRYATTLGGPGGGGGGGDSNVVSCMRSRLDARTDLEGTGFLPQG